MIGETNQEQIAANHTRNVWIDNLAVGASPSTTILPLTFVNPSALAPVFSANVQTRLVGALVQFLPGSANAGYFATITAASASSITVETLPKTPVQGDKLVILPSIEVNVSAPENIAQVGGTAQTGADWTPLLQNAAVKQSTLTDRSGSITTGGTAQQLAPANGNRRYLLIQNPLSATTQGIATAESLFINFTTTAVAGEPSIELGPGQGITMEGSFISTELISIIAATTGHKWTAKEG